MDEEELGEVKVDKLYRWGENRSDKVRRLSKNRWLYAGSFLLIRQADGNWYAESADEHHYLCDGNSLSDLLDNVEKNLDPDYNMGDGLAL